MAALSSASGGIEGRQDEGAGVEADAAIAATDAAISRSDWLWMSATILSSRQQSDAYDRALRQS
jgi:hypothetical protein